MEITTTEPTVIAAYSLLGAYRQAEAEHPGVLILIRVGDFYEAWGDSAKTLAEALQITLTGRNEAEGRIPMAGVPYHSVEKYLAVLLNKGFKVALCEEL